MDSCGCSMPSRANAMPVPMKRRPRPKLSTKPRSASAPSKPNCAACVARHLSPKTHNPRATGSRTIMAKKLYIETVGCQMNVLDSELVVGTLRRQGYELIHEPTEADVILFNTCSVRQHAEDKIYSALGRLRAHKQRHPSKIVGVLGCMAQKDQELVRRRA